MRTTWIIVLGVSLLILGVESDDVSPEDIKAGQELVRAIYEDVERSKKEYLPRVWANEQKEVCYEEIGCFSKVDGPFSFTTVFPESPEKIGTTFSLFTANNLDKPVALSYTDKSTLDTVLLDPLRPLAVITHGLNEDGDKKWIARLKEALLNKGYGSVIVVDWSKGAPLILYGQAMVNSELVGRQIAYILELLHNTRSLQMYNVHLLGYSLGAHASGFTGKTIAVKLGQKIARITGLDPAGPNFETRTEKTHLSYQDAEFVDVIHTSAGNNMVMGDLGIIKPIGHVDHYPNGGSRQPGCGFLDLVCSHRRAEVLYLESMSHLPCVFTSAPCPGGYDDYKAGKCDCGESGCGELGFESQKAPGRGTQYLRTNSKVPYCQNTF